MRYCFLKQKPQESFHFLTYIGRFITSTKLMQDLFLSQFNPYHSKDTLILGATIEDVVPFPPEAEDGRNPIESGKAEPAQITLQKLQQILWEVRKSAWNSFLRNIQFWNFNSTKYWKIWMCITTIQVITTRQKAPSTQKVQLWLKIGYLKTVFIRLLSS